MFTLLLVTVVVAQLGSFVPYAEQPQGLLEEFTTGTFSACEHQGSTTIYQEFAGGTGCILYTGQATECGGDCQAFVKVLCYRAGRLEDVTATALPAGARGVFYSRAAAADVNGDGHQDLFYSGFYNLDSGGSKYVALLINNGDGTFRDATAGLPTDSIGALGVIEFVDVDGDGDLDLSIQSVLTVEPLPFGFFRLFENDGTGVFTDVSASYWPATVTNAFSLVPNMAWGDYNGDGRQDLYVSFIAANLADINNPIYHKMLLMNQGTRAQMVDEGGTWLAGVQPIWIGAARSIDYDGDGDVDLFSTGGIPENITNGSPDGGFNYVYLLRNDNNTGFTDVRASVIPDIDPSRLTALYAGFPHTGNATIIDSGLTPYSKNDFQVFEYDGTRFVKQPTTYISNSEAYQEPSISFADYNGDGREDLVLAGRAERISVIVLGTFSTFLNTGGLNQVERTSVQLPNFPQSPVVGSSMTYDIDADGCTDIIITGMMRYTGRSLAQALAGDCNGGFVDIPSLTLQLGSVSYGMFSWSDFDNDGDEDMFLQGIEVIGGDYFYRLRLLERTEVYSWVDRSSTGLPSPGDMTRVGLGSNVVLDLDSDDYTDIYVNGVIDSNTLGTYVLRNMHNMSFELQSNAAVFGPSFEHNYFGSATIYDFDGDGRGDIFYTGLCRPLIAVYPINPVNPFDADTAMRVYINQGNMTMRDKTATYISANVYTYFASIVEQGDFDGDGVADFLLNGISKEYERSIRYMTFLPNRTLSDVPGRFIGGAPVGFTGGMAVEDINGDGHMDFVMTGLGNLDITAPEVMKAVGLGLGNGSFVNVTEDVLPNSVTEGSYVGRVSLVRDNDQVQLVQWGGQKCPPRLFLTYTLPEVSTTSGGGDGGSSDDSSALAGAAVAGTLGGLLILCILGVCGACVCCAVVAVVLIAVVVAFLLVAAVVVLVVVGLLAVGVAGGGGAGLTAVVSRKLGGSGGRRPDIELSEVTDDGGEVDMMAVQAKVDSTNDYQKLEWSELEFKRKIGEGAYGSVFLGLWRGVKVAIKVIQENRIDAQAVDEFHHEATMMAKVSHHPNVIQFLGAVVEAKRLALLTRYCARGSLESLLAKNELSIEQKLRMSRDAAAGVAFLHAQGIVHRDIAARNFLVNENFTVFVSDFGYSRLFERSGLDDAQKTKSDIGPIRWMAPEAISQHVYSNSTDIWSFGVALWEIFHDGRLPYDEVPSVVDVAVKVAKEGLRLSIAPGTPAAVASIMRRCWSLLPSARPRMEEIVAELSDVAPSEVYDGIDDFETSTNVSNMNYAVLSAGEGSAASTILPSPRSARPAPSDSAGNYGMINTPAPSSGQPQANYGNLM